jgi:hypothetical protein
MFTDISNIQTESNSYSLNNYGYKVKSSKKPIVPIRTTIMDLRHKPIKQSSWCGWVPLDYNDSSGKDKLYVNWKEKPKSPVKEKYNPIKTRILYR